MKQVKKITFCGIITMILILTCGCHAKGTLETKVQEQNGKIQIGFSIDSLVIERWQRDIDVFVSKVQELNGEVNVQNANGDLEQQVSQIEYFIEKEVDVIVVVAIDSDGLTEVLQKARGKNIKVVAYDRFVKNVPVDLYISFDNKKVGQLMAENIIDNIGRTGEIIMISGPMTDNNVQLIMEGFQKVIKQTKVIIKHITYADNWLSETGFNVTSDYLATGAIPNAIMCGNDSIAGQAIKALSENRKAGKVYVVGQDADIEACQRIVEGTQAMTVYKPVERLAQRAAELAIMLAQNKDINIVQTIEDEGQTVPYECLEPIAVTKKNMREIIIGKFHQEDEVYLNVAPDDRDNS